MNINKSINISKNTNSLITSDIQNNNNNKGLNKNIIIKYNDYELNSMIYEEALKYDKRTYIQYYCSLLKTKHLLLFAFVPSNDYNSTTTKICLFFFAFSLYYTVNALFFNDSTIHEINEEEGQYNNIYQ